MRAKCSEGLIGAYNGILTYHVRGMPSKHAQGKFTGHECRESAHDGHEGKGGIVCFWPNATKKVVWIPMPPQ